jgi:hypothetical protein
MIMSHNPNLGENKNIGIANELFENVKKFKYLRMILKMRMTFLMKSKVD